MNLLSDAAQSQTWPTIAPLITKGKTLYFSHGFSIVYKEDTKVIAPPDVDVILVAPKGSGRTVRTLFKEGRGINSSVAVFQDVTGKAKEKAIALGVGIGSGYMYDTTFEKEVYSDLYGERGVVRTNSLRSKSEILTRFCSSWAPSVCFFARHFKLDANIVQRVSSSLNTRSCARTGTPRRRPSTRPSRRQRSLSTPSSASTGMALFCLNIYYN
jgi:hypothetical protein